MHNNYFFISKLYSELKEILPGAELTDCFSQNKDELVLGFLLASGREFYIVAALTSSFSALYFPEKYHRARKNSITLFEEILRRKVDSLKLVNNERMFSLEFEGGLRLVFKLFGNRANIILLENNEAVKIFKSSLKQDRNFTFPSSGKNIDLSFNHIRELQFDIRKAVPVLGDLPALYLQSRNFFEENAEKKKKIWDEMIACLLNPWFFIIRLNGKYILSLLEFGNVHSVHTSAIEAANAFYQAHYRFNFLEAEKEKLISELIRKKKEGSSYIKKCIAKIEEIEKQDSPSGIADIIMANLHNIPPGISSVKLFDFYSNREVEIKLKKDLNPQKYAELLYKKAKGRPREIEILRSQIERKEKELNKVESDLQEIEKADSYNEIESLKKKYIHSKKDREAEEDKFRIYEVQGFKILVGKSAANNEELTQRFARKNDLWLHVRDVPGSHVVIKQQPGKNFPRPVIEAAAALAAFYSKRKNESLCPVIYTEKKYVRKIKGTPPGQMKVEKENVIMIVPKDIG